ncbi:MAG: AMP-binding protein [Actinomycetota bacterium]|nr:AMP-binding protein [Actinomycetota bacterium]
MRAPSSPTGHVDTFAADHLPVPSAQPELVWDHPSLQYPDRLNCGAELLDAMVATGHDASRCLRDAAGREWTYSEVLAWSNRIANVLINERGLVPGNRVLLRGPNSPWLAACWLAVQKAGLVAVATMPMLRAGELHTVIGKAQVDLALCDTRFLDELVAGAPAGLRIVSYGDDSQLSAAMTSASDVFSNCDTAASDVSLIAFTSGTTGQPKGCVHFHRDVLAIADTFSKHVIEPEADDLFTGSPPLAFTFGLGNILIFPMRVGACALLLEAASPPVLLAAIAEHRVTIVATAPTAYRAMLDAIPSTDISSWRKGVSAGEPLPLATRKAFEAASGIKLIDGLGATEMLHVFISAAGDDIRDGAIGRPVPGFAATILDTDGNEVPAGEIGRLAVKGPTGCRYLADDRQASYVHDGWNFPGDSMWRDADGYFWYAARADDMIISAGYSIAGPEVEGALLTHPDVAECACVGIPDDERGMVVKAFVVARDPALATDAFVQELQDHVKKTIAPFKYPRRIEFRAELPRTATGKLQRYKLRAER